MLCNIIKEITKGLKEFSTDKDIGHSFFTPTTHVAVLSR
jgi:hypothetical protein